MSDDETVGAPNKPAADDDGPLPYRERWAQRLRAGVDGQRLDRPSTWRMDRLFHAACWQCKTEEAEGSLALALRHDAHIDTIAALLAEYEHVRETTHRVFLGECDSTGRETESGRRARKARMRRPHAA
ncbi:MAG TPA: hypothetical protein VJO33_06680 [Gemmatimonadaceae bacterium]|nr:hypothetical protein [Gemmatimonadaceae bacterium]